MVSFKCKTIMYCIIPGVFGSVRSVQWSNSTSFVLGTFGLILLSCGSKGISEGILIWPLHSSLLCWYPIQVPIGECLKNIFCLYLTPFLITQSTLYSYYLIHIVLDEQKMKKNSQIIPSIVATTSIWLSLPQWVFSFPWILLLLLSKNSLVRS